MYLNASLGHRSSKQRKRVFNYAVQIEAAERGRVAIKAQHLAHNPRDSLILGAERLENRLPLWIQFPTEQMNGVFHGFEWIIDLMGNGPRQTAGGGEFLHLKHAPLHLQLLQLLPSGEITQNSHCIRDLTSGVIDLS